MKNELSVTVDMGALLKVKLDNFAAKNKCCLDAATMDNIRTVYEELDKIVEDSFGEIMGVDVTDEGIAIRANAMELAFFCPEKESVQQLLTLVDNIHVKQVRGEYVTATVTMKCSWEPVQE